MPENKIKECRLKAGYSQVELARRAGMGSTNLNAIENGRLKAWPKVKRKLARVLKVTEAELFPEAITNDNDR
jgi:transcriptional regulator with XRE-family HTH domain